MIDVSKLTDAELEALGIAVVVQQGKRLAIAAAHNGSKPEPVVVADAKPPYTIDEVVKKLNYSTSTIRRRMKDDENFPKPLNHKPGGVLRFRASEIDALALTVDAEHIARILDKLDFDDDVQRVSKSEVLLHECSTEPEVESKSS